MFFFTSRDGWTVYMGRDKFENDELIQHSFGDDIWFHVDEVSSAHVYLRLAPGTTIADVPAATLEDCAQLVKANSISGSKMRAVTVIYTYVANLRKDEQTMDVGTVGFHDMRQVHYMRDVAKSPPVVGRIEKTRTERTVRDLQRDTEMRERERRAEKKAAEAQRRRDAEEAERARREQAELQSYSAVMRPELMRSNAAPSHQTAEQYEDDFM